MNRYVAFWTCDVCDEEGRLVPRSFTVDNEGLCQRHAEQQTTVGERIQAVLRALPSPRKPTR